MRALTPRRSEALATSGSVRGRDSGHPTIPRAAALGGPEGSAERLDAFCRSPEGLRRWALVDRLSDGYRSWPRRRQSTRDRRRRSRNDRARGGATRSTHRARALPARRWRRVDAHLDDPRSGGVDPRRGGLACARDPVRLVAPLEHADALRRHRTRDRPFRRGPCRRLPRADARLCRSLAARTGRRRSPRILRALAAYWDGLYDIEISPTTALAPVPTPLGGSSREQPGASSATRLLPTASAAPRRQTVKESR